MMEAHSLCCTFWYLPMKKKKICAFFAIIMMLLGDINCIRKKKYLQTKEFAELNGVELVSCCEKNIDMWFTNHYTVRHKQKSLESCWTFFNIWTEYKYKASRRRAFQVTFPFVVMSVHCGKDVQTFCHLDTSLCTGRLQNPTCGWRLVS